MKDGVPGIQSLPLNIPSICLMRASAVEADRAHNPEVVGSNPTPATKTRPRGAVTLPFSFGDNNLLVRSTLERGGILGYC